MGEWRETEIGKIPIDWEYDKLENHLIIKGRIGWKGLKISEYIEEGPFIIGGLQFKNDKIVWDECAHITEERYGESPEIMLRDDDILMTKDGTIGKLAYISNLKHKATVASHIHVIREKSDKVFPKFLFYFFKSPVFQFVVESKITGSVVPALTQYDINNTYFPIPNIPEQKAIASVLSSLDDKIDLLHQQNKTLEALAETLFRQWFVEEAQDDWEDGTLDDIVELIYGKGLKSSLRTGFGFPVIGSSGIVDFHWDYLVEGPGIVIGRKGTLGKTNYIEENFYPIDTTYYVKSKGKRNHLYFEYFLLKNIDFEEMNTDSAVPGLNRDIALSVELRIPPAELIDEFNEFAKMIFDKRRNNKSQIRTLQKMRDTLLPKLMSGEVRLNMEG